MAADMTPIATVEREAKLEGKNMFMILAPRPVPTGPPKFTSLLHPERAAEQAAADQAASDAHDRAAEAEIGHAEPETALAEADSTPEPETQGVPSSA
jgi:hypothetical protein